jgi:hypothetical protein
MHRIDRILHDSPVWGDLSNLRGVIELWQDGQLTGVEELWLKRLSSGFFMVCCVPFFAYGIALGDEVECVDDATVDGVSILRIEGVKNDGGHGVLRVFFQGTTASSVKPTIVTALHQFDAILEWRSANYVAIDCPNDLVFQQVLGVLDSLNPGDHTQWQYEIAKEPSSPFAR